MPFFEGCNEGMTAPSSILAWRIPWTEEPGGLQSMGFKEPNMTERLIMYRIWSLTHYNFSITLY